ncbi:type II toxin-antitoxin system RelE/ParE family toxin [Enterobacteriaceae bacterium ESL0689]|nr:type II toxin-antitoxin system RelE/ParE family toxin [Enterobacteriaceae bacterium ESL0689]
MRVIWTKEVIEDRTAIWDYLAERNPVAALKLDELFSESAAGLAEHLLMGPAGQIAGTRELVLHEHYRLVCCSFIMFSQQQ